MLITLVVEPQCDDDFEKRLRDLPSEDNQESDKSRSTLVARLAITLANDWYSQLATAALLAAEKSDDPTVKTGTAEVLTELVNMANDSADDLAGNNAASIIAYYEAAMAAAA